MKILYTYRTEEEKIFAEEALKGEELVLHKDSLEEGEWSGEGVECLSVFVNSPVTREVMEKCPNLKLVATQSTGFDHIDLAAAKEKGITVVNVPSYGEHTVAEFAFALMLALSRKIIAANKKVELGSFSAEGLEGFDLNGKTLGVVGTGKIGKNVIKIAKGFNMKVVAFDLFKNEELLRELDFSYVELDELLASADIVTLHLPENNETRGIINRDSIAKMKKGSYIINTARGGLIETDALVQGLRSGVIAGAGLDVLVEEGNVDDELRLLEKPHPNEENLKTLLMNHYLIEHPRVLVTPHTAFNTVEAKKRILETTIKNIQNFSSGAPTNIVEI